MSKWKPVLAVLLVFIAGMFVGVVGTGIIVRRVVQQMVNHPDALQRRIQNGVGMQLARRLNLDAAQRRRVNDILMETQGELKVIRDETQPRIAQIRSNAVDQINAILTPQQRVDFERLREENRPVIQLSPLGPLTPTR